MTQVVLEQLTTHPLTLVLNCGVAIVRKRQLRFAAKKGGEADTQGRNLLSVAGLL